MRLLSSQQIINILTEHGFIFISQKGSHQKYRKGKYTVIVPFPKKEIPVGTLRSIIRQSGLDPVLFKFPEEWHDYRKKSGKRFFGARIIMPTGKPKLAPEILQQNRVISNMFFSLLRKDC